MEKLTSPEKTPGSQPASKEIGLKNPRGRLAATLLAACACAPACGNDEGTADAGDAGADAATDTDTTVDAGTVTPTPVQTTDAGTPEEVPVCERPEHQTPTAPAVETGHFYITGDRLRVYFRVPDFDAECKAPLSVRVRATLWQNPAHSASYGEGADDTDLLTVTFPGETLVYVPGDGYFVDSEMHFNYDGRAYDSVSSFSLIVTDAQGRTFETPPEVLE